MKSDESNIIVCKDGYRIVGIENSKKGVFVYGTKRDAVIDTNFADTATSLTMTKFPTNDCYQSAEVISSFSIFYIYKANNAYFLKVSASALAFHADKIFQCLLDRYKCTKPIIYAGEIGWHDGLVSIDPENVRQGEEVANILEDQPQPFAAILKHSARELYFDILPLVVY